MTSSRFLPTNTGTVFERHDDLFFSSFLGGNMADVNISLPIHVLGHLSAEGKWVSAVTHCIGRAEARVKRRHVLGHLPGKGSVSAVAHYIGGGQRHRDCGPSFSDVVLILFPTVFPSLLHFILSPRLRTPPPSPLLM